MNILLGDSSGKAGKKDIFKTANVNKNLDGS
jgi:hypothetical protein